MDKGRTVELNISATVPENPTQRFHIYKTITVEELMSGQNSIVDTTEAQKKLGSTLGDLTKKLSNKEIDFSKFIELSDAANAKFKEECLEKQKEASKIAGTAVEDTGTLLIEWAKSVLKENGVPTEDTGGSEFYVDPKSLQIVDTGVGPIHIKATPVWGYDGKM